MAKKAAKKESKTAAFKKALKLVKPGAKKAATPKKAKAPKAPKVKVADKGKPKSVAKSARSQALPGMETIVNAVLNSCAESIADCRATINSAKQEEAGYIQTALREMQKEALRLGQTSYAYKHNGVELLLVPGDAKLRIRALKDGGENDEVGLDRDEPLVQTAAGAAATADLEDGDEAGDEVEDYQEEEFDEAGADEAGDE